MFPGSNGAHLASEGDGPEWDDEEEVRNVGLDALPVQDLTFTRAERENMYIGAHQLQKGPLTRRSRR